MRKWHLGAALLTAAAIPALAAGCEAPPLGQIMLIVKTDMAPPKDFDTLRIEVFNEGALKFEYEGPIPGDPDDDQKVVLPSTLGLVASEDPANAIRIEVGVRSGGNEGKVRVVREIVTTIPPDRVAMLNVPIQFLCKKDDIPLDNQNNLKPSDCPEGKTCIAGTCEDSVVDSSTLPDYDEDEVFGGSGNPETGVCFDVQKCFSAAQLVDAQVLNLETCSFPLAGAPVDGANFALGVESDGICNGVGCFVALDANSDTGWKVSDDGTSVILPGGVCANLAGDTPSSLKVLQIVQAPVSEDCPLKEVKYPTCGPWSAVESSTGESASAVAIAGAQDHPIAASVIADEACVDACPEDDPACVQGCDRAYWTNAGNPDAEPPTPPSIKGVSVDGGASGSVDLVEPPRDILASPEGLFFTSASATGQGSVYVFLFAPALEQDALVQLQGNLTQPDGIARAGNNLFWTEFLDPGRVYKGTLAPDLGSFTDVQEISLNNPYPVRIVADGQFIYWTNESTFMDKLGAVARIDHTEAMPTTQVLTTDALNVPRALAIDIGENNLATDLYFATLADGKVWRIPNASAATPGAAEVFAEGLSAPNGIAVDGKNVYIANRGNGTILYKPKTAGASDPAKVIAAGQKNPGHILVAGTNLIWVNEGPSKTDQQEGSIVKFDVSKL
jgi:hypothetical protein